MIRDKIDRYFARNRCTLLGVGPMSKNCVDASIELANDYEIPLFLIASRRQIDCSEFGGGYVENWTTEAFAKYVLETDKKGMIILSRDHGGPWQNEFEKSENLSLKNAMDCAKRSFASDIFSGFQKIHIDPSIDIHGTPNVDQILDRVFELYETCWQEAQRCKSDIIFEIGTEEQSGSTNSQEELNYTLEKLKLFCQKNNIPDPTFVVVQGGTKVLETRNVGTFGLPLRVKNEIPPDIQIPNMLEVCRQHNVYMKAHNTDYLPSDVLSWYPKLGIHAANIAPEFGVIESKTILGLLEELDRKDLVERFLELSFNSNKWSKWMVPGSEASDIQKSVISGHYVFSTEEFKDIKADAELICISKGLEINEILKSAVKKAILRYVDAFRLKDLK